MHLAPKQSRRAFIPLNALAMSGVMSPLMPVHHAGIGPEPRA